MIWQTSRYQIDLSAPRVMGIVNITPDSFSDGGHFIDASAALAHCESLIRQGADVLDIGGESSRPGAPSLSVEDEWLRIEPVLSQAVTLGVPVSVDTCKTEVMQRALDLGADIINDIKALGAPGAEAVVASHPSCGVCLMHMQGDPATMQSQADYVDVVQAVSVFLEARAKRMLEHGVAASRIVLDPGIGFGKLPEHNLDLLRRQEQLLALGYPLLLGWSRKSTLGVITGKPVEERLVASVAAALACISKGARLVRVHDVAATVDAIRIWQAAGLMARPASDNPPNDHSGHRH